MKNKLFRKHASVIPTGAPTLRSGQAAWSGGIPSFRRFLATLGMTVLFCWSATAQNGVSVSNLDVKPGTVTFNVNWKKAGMPTLWSDSVWVFVDYNDAGVMKRLPIISATATAGTVTKIQGNNKGVWVIGNARSAGNFSATVKLHTATADLAGVCAYASNYPPVAEYTAAYEIKFTGTPMYNIVLEHASGSTITRRSDSPFSVPAYYTVQSFTDATGAPGIPPVKPDAPPFAATYQTWKFGSSTLTWSDRIAFDPPNCTRVYDKTSSTAADEYLVDEVEGLNVYFYSLTCLRRYAETLCPSPWRVPTSDDYTSIGQLSAYEMSMATWYPVALYHQTGTWFRGEYAMEWCPTPLWTNAYFVMVSLAGVVTIQTYYGGSDCTPVRCVR